MRVGRSVHSLAGAVGAAREGADLLVVGTVFPSSSHLGGPASGVGLLRAVSRAVDVPVLAIGGVTQANARDVMEAGADGAAVISAVLSSDDPARAARGLLGALTVPVSQSPTVVEAAR